ncbi:MAG: hypothetical protein GYB68_09700 [Chloroflexi bacterium]|nr:hypothetical protein [Chloroflexota bacterium]
MAQAKTNDVKVQIFTSDHVIIGDFTVVGRPEVFINDQNFISMRLKNVTLTPINPGTPVGDITTPALHVPKKSVQLMVIGDFGPDSLRMLPQLMTSVLFTDTYTIRGTFHIGSDWKLQDFFYTMPGPFFPMTDVEILPLRDVVADVSGQAELAFINGAAPTVFFDVNEKP